MLRPEVVLGFRSKSGQWELRLGRFSGPTVRQPCWEMKRLWVTGDGEKDFGVICPEWCPRG